MCGYERRIWQRGAGGKRDEAKRVACREPPLLRFVVFHTQEISSLLSVLSQHLRWVPSGLRFALNLGKVPRLGFVENDTLYEKML